MPTRSEILDSFDPQFVAKYDFLAHGALKWQVELGYLADRLEDPRARLTECTINSIKNAMLDSAATALSISPTLRHAYIARRGESADGKLARFIVSYLGFEYAALRDGGVCSIQTGIVREGDPFEIRVADNIRLINHTELQPRDKPMTSVYTIATYANGATVSETMSAAAIEACRKMAADNSKAWLGPFAEEMWKKCCVRRASKHWPIGHNMASVVAAIDRNEPMRFDEKLQLEDETEYVMTVTTEHVDAARAALVDLGLTVVQANDWLERTARAMSYSSFAQLPHDRYEDALARMKARMVAITSKRAKR